MSKKLNIEASLFQEKFRQESYCMCFQIHRKSIAPFGTFWFWSRFTILTLWFCCTVRGWDQMKIWLSTPNNRVSSPVFLSRLTLLKVKLFNWKLVFLAKKNCHQTKQGLSIVMRVQYKMMNYLGIQSWNKNPNFYVSLWSRKLPTKCTSLTNSMQMFLKKCEHNQITLLALKVGLELHHL